MIYEQFVSWYTRMGGMIKREKITDLKIKEAEANRERSIEYSFKGNGDLVKQKHNYIFGEPKPQQPLPGRFKKRPKEIKEKYNHKFLFIHEQSCTKHFRTNPSNH